MASYFSYVQLISTGEVFLARRYVLDPDKYTLYSRETMEPLHNAYRSEVRLISSIRVYLAGHGGKNPRKRRYLGKLQYIMERTESGWRDPGAFTGDGIRHVHVTEEGDGYWKTTHVNHPRAFFPVQRDTWCTKHTYHALEVKDEAIFQELCSKYPEVYPPTEVPKDILGGESNIKSMIPRAVFGTF